MGVLISIEDNKNIIKLDDRKYNEKRMKPVVQMDEDGNEINAFPSIAAAEKITGIKHIYECVNNKKYRKTAGGYRWKLQGE